VVETHQGDLKGPFTPYERNVPGPKIPWLKWEPMNRKIGVEIGQNIQERGKSELDNSLFLTADISRFDGLNRSAYDTLRDEFN